MTSSNLIYDILLHLILPDLTSFTPDAKELKHITTVLGVQTDEEQIDDMVREVDVDGDGDIDFQEFVMMIRK